MYTSECLQKNKQQSWLYRQFRCRMPNAEEMNEHIKTIKKWNTRESIDFTWAQNAQVKINRIRINEIV